MGGLLFFAAVFKQMVSGYKKDRLHKLYITEEIM
jgi:hypothetical protein